MSAAVRWPRRQRPVELVVAESRIGVLRHEKAELTFRLNEVLGENVALLTENIEMRRELERLRGQRAKLARAVRNRSSLDLPADLLGMIAEEGLAE